MKKLLLSTIVLLAFSVSILLFQISCKKEAKAQSTSYVLPPATTSKLGGVIPDGTSISVDANGKIATANANQNKIIYTTQPTQTLTTLWTANGDGTNPQQINVGLPTGKMINGLTTLSPDHKKIYFTSVTTTSPYVVDNYVCNIDGSNLQQLALPTHSQIYFAY